MTYRAPLMKHLGGGLAYGPYLKVEKSDQTDFKSKYQMSENLVVVLIVTGECEADTIDI